MKIHSLHIRLFLAFITVVVFGVTTAVIFANYRTTHEFTGYVVRNFEQEQQTIAFLLQQEIAREGVAAVQPLVQSIGTAYGRSITLADSQGQILIASSSPAFYSGGADILRPVPAWNAPVNTIQQQPIILTMQTMEEGAVVAPPFSGVMPIASEAISFTAGLPAPADVIRYTLPNNEQLFLGSINQSFLIAAVGAVAIAGVLSFGISQRILEPVEALTQAARKMEKGDLSQRVAVVGKDEIGELGHAFNAMADGLTQMEQLRRNMVTDIAHELRTPLSNIRGYLEALQDGVLQPDEAAINSLHEEALLLNRLIEDLQELSLAEAGKLRLVKQQIRPFSLITQAINSILPQATEHELTITTKVTSDLPEVEADPERIGQVLRNLLYNAITHTPPGGKITISAVQAEGFVHIQVTDTGHGISPENLPYVFDRFYRADPSRQRATGGSGLGLSIVKALVEMHNGRIWAKSTLGQGSCFTFSLPLSPL